MLLPLYQHRRGSTPAVPRRGHAPPPARRSTRQHHQHGPTMGMTTHGADALLPHGLCPNGSKEEVVSQCRLGVRHPCRLRGAKQGRLILASRIDERLLGDLPTSLQGSSQICKR